MEPRRMDVTMELNCKLAVVNRQGGFIGDLSQGSIVVRNMNKKSTPLEEPFITVCTSSDDIEDDSYNLIGNIEHLSTEFLNQGQVTVCLKEPSSNIFITHADPKKLSAFISYLKQLLPKDSPLHPPSCQINLYLNGQKNYKLRMENIIEMLINLDYFTDLEIRNCTLELEGYQVSIAGAIKKMKNLTTLRLKEIVLRSSTFLEIESKELKLLHLHKCETPLPIASLFKNDLCYKDSLVKLRLGENQWSEIPNGIFQFQNLLKLSLRDNHITELPDKFTNLPKLQELSLSYNSLTHVPPSIFALQNLSKLELDFNHISELPDMFTNLSQLQELSLSFNQITHLPPSMLILQNLSKLHLIDNLISDLPDIINLPNLNNLTLDDNQLRHIPPSIFAHQNLSKLLLRDNLISELPDIINLPKLATLRLCNNQFRYIPAIIFEMQNLSHLSLSHNYITELLDMFINLPKLEYLSLSRNQIHYLPPSILLLHLKYLDIENNVFNFKIPPSVGSEIVHSLQELSYRAILKHKLIVEEGMLPKRFLKDLDNYRQCICGCKFEIGREVSFLCNLSDILRDFNTLLHRNPRIPIRGNVCNSAKSCFLSVN